MSEQSPTSAANNTFERIKRVNFTGAKFWSARELARVLEYSGFRHFLPVIEKAREACLNSAHRIEDHFGQILEMVNLGSGGAAPRGRLETVPLRLLSGYPERRSQQTAGSLGSKLLCGPNPAPGAG